MDHPISFNSSTPSPHPFLLKNRYFPFIGRDQSQKKIPKLLKAILKNKREEQIHLLIIMKKKTTIIKNIKNSI